MSLSAHLLSKVWGEALDIFFLSEAAQIYADVNERNLGGRLGFHLQTIANREGMTGYYADTEYNRKQNGAIKTIIDGDCRVVKINCDLILHSRGTRIADDNLIAVELKKSDRPEEEKNNDRIRLRALTRNSFDGIWSNDGTTHPEHVCGYRMGFFIGLDRSTGAALVELYEKGSLISVINRKF